MRPRHDDWRCYGSNPSVIGMNKAQTDGLSPAVFLDRDGTLVKTAAICGTRAKWRSSRRRAALCRLQERFSLFIVTNQSGVGKSELTLDEAGRVNDYVVQWLREREVEIAGVYCCPHRRDENCACIKPKPFFLEHAAREHGLDLCRSFVIGDHPHDVEFARSVGATGIYVLTGHGLKHQAELRGNENVAANIAAAADWILATRGAIAPDAAASPWDPRMNVRSGENSPKTRLML